MRTLARLLLRLVMEAADARALLGDLNEDCARRVRPRYGWFIAQFWYAREVGSAVLTALRDRMHLRLPRFALLADVRYALRRWRRRPGFAIAAVLTLGLGIGATTAIFSVIDAVVLRPLPWDDPDNLYVIHAVHPERRQDPARAGTWNRGQFSLLAWDALRELEVFEDVALWGRYNERTVGENRTEMELVFSVSSQFLPLLGVDVVLGRHFTTDEDMTPLYNVLITHETWQRRFGGQPDIVGRAITLGSASSGGQWPYTIVGVVEPGFRFAGEQPAVLMPIGFSASTGRRYPAPLYRLLSRPASGVDVEALTAAARAVVSAVETAEPTDARLVPLALDELGDRARPLWLLFAASGLLLVVACSNVASLLVGEARRRRHEVAVRQALGSGHARIARQALVEHLMITVTGAVAGVLLALWMTPALVALAPPELPRLDMIVVDWRIAAFAFALAAATVLVFGIGPVLALGRVPTTLVLAEGFRDATPGRHLAQRATVAAQIALALVLLVAAGLFAESVLRLTLKPLGFDPANLAVVSFTYTGRPDGAAIRAAMAAGQNPRVASERDRSNSVAALVARVVSQVEARPGIVDAAAISTPPFFGSTAEVEIRIPGETQGDTVTVPRSVVSEGYFGTMGMPVLDGRDFDQTDSPLTYQAVVSRGFAARFLPGSATGQTFDYMGYRGGDPTVITYEVIGVVPDVRQSGYLDDERARFYALDRQLGQVTRFVIRTASDPERVLPVVRQTIGDLAPQFVVTEMTTMDARMASSVAGERFRATLSVAFGVAALLLAAVGLYGVAARRAAARRREFGVRVALGAGPANVRRLVFSDACWVVGLGLALGLPAAYAASQLTTAYLFEVSPTSPHTFALASAVLAAASIVATLLPAQRASRQDPVEALR